MSLADLQMIASALSWLWSNAERIKTNKKEAFGLIDRVRKYEVIFETYRDNESSITGQISAAIISFKEVIDEINSYVKKYALETMWDRGSKFILSTSKAAELASLHTKLDRLESFFGLLQRIDANVYDILSSNELFCIIDCQITIEHISIHNRNSWRTLKGTSFRCFSQELKN